MTLCVASLTLSSGCTIPERLILNDATPGVAVTAASIAAARSRWLAAGINDYDFSPRCDGWITAVPPPPAPGVLVRNGHVVRSRYFEDFLNLKSAPTMDAIFDNMQRVVSSPKYHAGTVHFEARFDAQTGIPTYVFLEDTDLSDSWEHCSIGRVWVWRRQPPKAEQRPRLERTIAR
jgi:hypothetical protein